MTLPATFKTPDLRRLAKISNEHGVYISIERDGQKIGISPDKGNNKDRINDHGEIRL